MLKNISVYIFSLLIIVVVIVANIFLIREFAVTPRPNQVWGNSYKDIVLKTMDYVASGGCVGYMETKNSSGQYERKDIILEYVKNKNTYKVKSLDGNTVYIQGRFNGYDCGQVVIGKDPYIVIGGASNG